MNEEITCNKGLTHFWVVKVIFTICKLGRKRPVMFRHYGRMLTTLTTSSVRLWINKYSGLFDALLLAVCHFC